MNAECLVTFLTIFVFGLIICSFLNVVIYRLPLKKSIIFPDSYCPSCGTPIKCYDNIPIISYILLGGKCRSCCSKISIQYPLVEILTASMAVILYIKNGLSLDLISDFSLGSIVLAASLIDTKYMIIPDRLNFAGAVIALFIGVLKGFGGIERGLAGGFLGFIILLIMYWMGKILFKRDGVGLGDVKFAAVIGFFCGPLWCFMALVLAIVIGGVWGIIQLLTRKKMVGMQVPFGPFMGTGVFFVLFFRIQLLYLVEQYLGLFH